MHLRPVLILLPFLALFLVSCLAVDGTDRDAVPISLPRSEPASPQPAEAAPSLPGGIPRQQAVIPPSFNGDLGVLLEKARRQWRQGDLDGAAESYRELVGSGNAPPEAQLEQGIVEEATGNIGAAKEMWQRVIDARPPEPLPSRARLLLARAELRTDNWDAVLPLIDASSAPDGLGDLVVLIRAEAADGAGNTELARAELGRREMRESTNRLILERAGRLAEELGDPALAGELYARGGRYFGWTAERSRIIKVAGDAFLEAGEIDQAAEQYGFLVENYGWTAYAARAGATLESIGHLSPYHRGLIAINDGDFASAREFLGIAADSELYGAAASDRLGVLEEALAWRDVVSADSADAYRTFRLDFPDGSRAMDAWFEEGMSFYEAHQLDIAVAIWQEAAAAASGDQRARMLMWAGKAMAGLGDEGNARARLEAAAGVHPAGYYAMRARDLLRSGSEWPQAGGAPAPSDGAEEAQGEEWVASWAREQGSPSPEAERRAQRGFGLLALGLQADAAAEFNQLIAETEDGSLLFKLSRSLAREELWSSSSRAAGRLIALSPARSPVEAPPAIRRLAYPPAYWNLVSAESEKRGLDPWLLLSLMHQESRYDPFALSLADARGLTQVIPPTGRGIAAALGRDGFYPEQLYGPVVAVEFGAWYLANQLKGFAGDTFRGLAAYNAGAGPIPRWAASDPDLFVERIDYAETRSYVRQIYLHHAAYRSLTER